MHCSVALNTKSAARIWFEGGRAVSFDIYTHSSFQTQLVIEDSALHKMIAQYCREAGVRNLQKQLEKVYRKVAMKVPGYLSSTLTLGKIAKGEVTQVVVTPDNLELYLGKPRFKSDRLYDVPPPGVVTGLAWNNLGGALIWIESVVVHSKKAGLKTTGKLGKVMQESIEIAFTYAKKFINESDPTNSFFDTVRNGFPFAHI